MEKRGLKVYFQKTKLLVTGKKRDTAVESGRFPCGGCGSRVGLKSILCTSCNKWTYKRCSGLRNLNGVVNFRCRACDQKRAGQTLGREDIVLGQGENEVVCEVQEFCYLGDMVEREGGVRRAVAIRTAAAWSKWREIGGLLCDRGIPLKKRASIYEACIRSVLLYGTETWPMT